MYSDILLFGIDMFTICKTSHLEDWFSHPEDFISRNGEQIEVLAAKMA